MKKQTLWVRLLVLTLAFIMMTSVFAACAIEGEEGGNVENGTDLGGEKTVTFVEDSLEDLNFGTTLTILVDGSYGAQVAPSEEVAAGNLVRAVSTSVTRPLRSVLALRSSGSRPRAVAVPTRL